MAQILTGGQYKQTTLSLRGKNCVKFYSNNIQLNKYRRTGNRQTFKTMQTLVKHFAITSAHPGEFIIGA
jgi:hypothetical protein